MPDIVNYNLSNFEGYKVITIKGNISINTTSSIIEVIEEITDQSSLIINMENISLLTSSGMDTLIEISQNAYSKEKRIVFCKVRQEIKDMFLTFSVSHLILFADSIEEAAMKIRFYT